ncbi:hypothetical protein PF010_g5907 [Phytophthora fragariae]|uniref:Uncharacterized protein n=1 Tax=Phytophthora fragariae TaxID=53985 RepID=A0A6G0LMJ3_9STRA|nr:hypothetical protein PF010_g5907 [Phytophthora fragariae]KAE9244611.1 hypothetical protein PF004_g5607 [Phytophthora fragariae]
MKYWQSVSLKRIFKLIWVFCLLLCVCGGGKSYRVEKRPSEEAERSLRPRNG